MAETNREIGEQTPNLPERISISRAAMELKLTYHQAHALLLRGALRGGQGAEGWYVESASVVEYQAAQGAA